MNNLFIRPDGAQPQAAAVLAYLRQHDGIECSWSKENKRYMSEPEVNRWHNCREQGYVISMRTPNSKQINIAFFEHRNSDAICALVFEAFTLNPPTLSDIPENVYKDKWVTTHNVGYGKAAQMADLIIKQLSTFWSENSPA
jgi:hypothetical protein